MSVFISINHIPVAKGREKDFEKMFQERERAVEDMPGFISLDVLKPGQKMLMGEAPQESDNEYQVLTRWESEQAFHGWVGSEAFKKAHSRSFDPAIFAGRSYLTLHKTIEGVSAVKAL